MHFLMPETIASLCAAEDPMEFEAVAISIRKAFDAIQSRNLGACLVAKRIATPILQAPNAKGEFIFFNWSIKM
jgi:hypothetical protein